KRVYRIYTEEGLAVRTKHRKKIARRDRVPAPTPSRANQGWSMVSSAKNRSDGKPCSIRALANEMNQVKGRVTIAADNHVTHNVTRPRIRRRPGSRELLAIVLETWAFNSRCIFGELQVEGHIAGAIHDAHALLSQCLEDSFTGWRHSVCSPDGS